MRMGVESGEHTATNLRSVRSIPPPERRRLSESLWDIDYRSVFPLVVSDDGTVAELGDVDRAMEFVREHYSTVFGDARESSFWREDAEATRERYLRQACDLFLFSNGGRTVGLFMGNPVDWSTYYMRSWAFLEEYQSRGIAHGFLAALLPLLAKSGVARFETDTAPSNHQSIAAMMREGFVVSGSVVSERWGALARFTKYLNPEAEASFVKQFCASGDIHQRNHERFAARTVHSRKGVTQ